MGPRARFEFFFEALTAFAICAFSLCSDKYGINTRWDAFKHQSSHQLDWTRRCVVPQQDTHRAICSFLAISSSLCAYGHSCRGHWPTADWM